VATSNSTQNPPDSQDTQTTVLDVTAEMRKIREQVRQQVSITPAVPRTFDWAETRRLLRRAKEKWNVQELPFESSTPVIGPLLAAFRSAWNSVAAKWHVRRILNQQNAYNLVIYQLLQSLLQEAQISNANLVERLADLTEQLRQQDEWRQELELRLLVMRRAAGAPTSPVQDATDSSAQAGGDCGYLNFNVAFTGAGSMIKETYRQYVPLFAGAENVLDAGCGRGYFLELLKEAGIEGYGVDCEVEMVEMCRLKGFRAEVGDVIEHLSALPGDSLGGIFCGHLIEHLNPAVLQKFLALAHDRLRPGGVLICETPNTRSLFVMANTYYRDPTHQQPLHPETYQFMAQSEGFVNVELRYSLSPPSNLVAEFIDSSHYSDPSLQALTVEVNDRLQCVNQQLFGDQNVALIAYKPT
jgi:SAM-dependent methyltransferase